jgi:hypothetical protein
MVVLLHALLARENHKWRWPAAGKAAGKLGSGLGEQPGFHAGQLGRRARAVVAGAAAPGVAGMSTPQQKQNHLGQ